MSNFIKGAALGCWKIVELSFHFPHTKKFEYKDLFSWFPTTVNHQLTFSKFFAFTKVLCYDKVVITHFQSSFSLNSIQVTIMLVGADQNSRRLQFHMCLHISHAGDYVTGKTEKHLIIFLHKIHGSSRSQMLFKIGVPKNFANFTGKNLCLSLFLVTKTRVQHRCFPVNFKKFLRTPFFTEHLRQFLKTFLIKSTFKFQLF